ncbi:hypothetical protein Bbelb_440180 [Branchiostoma belcheri]|nr:hypothetical protein Bbelb_440180 [Branchiostoma belcheri]
MERTDTEGNVSLKSDIKAKDRLKGHNAGTDLPFGQQRKVRLKWREKVNATAFTKSCMKGNIAGRGTPWTAGGREGNAPTGPSVDCILSRQPDPGYILVKGKKIPKTGTSTIAPSAASAHLLHLETPGA